MRKKKPHPWAAFLNARYDAILWMEKEMGYSDKEIAINLSMDEVQVYLIKNSKNQSFQHGLGNKTNRTFEKECICGGSENGLPRTDIVCPKCDG